MTLLAAALALSLAAEPASSTPAPASTSTSSPSDAPPPSQWATGPETPPPPAPPAPPALPPMPHSVQHGQTAPVVPDFTLSGGWGANGLRGLASTGVELTFEAAMPGAARPQVLMLVTGDLYVGETGAGLAVRSFALGAEIWWDAGRVRLGGGVGTGVVGYRRATSGEWELDLPVGLRAGLEVAVLRFGPNDVVLGAHGAASLGPWLSGYVTAGWRFRVGPR